jgi:2-phosphoglycerate kinase
MIYLIGGAPRCGKTTLSKTIASKKRISFISMDVLRPMIMASFKKGEWKKIFPSENIETPKGKFQFEVIDSREAVKIMNIESSTTWPPIKALIEKLIEREEDYVIEGANLMPKYLKQLKRTKYRKHIRVVYLVKTDLEKIKNGFAKTTKGVYDWMYPYIKGDDDRITMAAQYVQGYGRYFEKEAKKNGFDVFNTQDNFNKVLLEAERHLMK